MGRKEHKEHQRQLEELRRRPQELQKPAAERMHPVIGYLLRILGAATLSFGGAGLMIGTSFIWSTVFICLGLTLLVIDPWLEPTLRPHSPFWRIPVSAIFVVVLASFLVCIVFLPCQLNIRVRDYNGDYEPGTKLGGIEWKPEYSDLRVVFENPTDYDCTNLDFVLNTDVFVSDVGQTTNLGGVQLFNTPTGPDEITAQSINKDTGKISYLPKNQMSIFTGGIRMLSDKLPKHSRFEVVMAVTVPPKKKDMEAGHLYGPRTPATKVHVDGHYESRGGRPHHIDEIYPVELK